MDGETTLRPAARRCGISLDTSFHLRHRLMELVKDDSYGQLSGIAEEDAHLAHESLADKLSLTAKMLVSSAGQRVKEGI
ncbi:hypothetical protein [Endozoicomonas sp.]|uniref:hypothetical protein n=1 Tax=Endozoicomonas sp. TaxID=1892382 RepID=UPI00383AA890